MKTTIVTSVLVFASIFSQASTAGQPKKVQHRLMKREANTAVASKTMFRSVEKQLFYPNSGSAQFVGQADLFFQVHPDGEVKLLRITACSPELEAFVRSQASSFKVDPTSFKIGEVFRYRFNFKREA